MSFTTVTYSSWPTEITLDTVDLRHKREELEKLFTRVEAFRGCTFRILDREYETLPDDVYDALDRADTRICKLMSWLEDAIESIDESIKALETLENNLSFVYEDVEDLIKKKGAA